MALELLIADEAVCLDKAPGDPKGKVVKCDSPQAAYQVIGKGAPISADDAKKFGVKTKPAEAAATLRIDSHTIARTPEEKKFAATQPQPALMAARAENMRAAANLTISSLVAEDQAKGRAVEEEAKAEDTATTKKLAAKGENKKRKGPTARKAKTTKAAAKKEEAAKPANG
jgi:hypothetical protein